MALPTLRPQWVKTFKNPVEITVNRVQREETNRTRWAENYSYFKSAEVTAKKNDAWTSERSFRRSMHAVDKIFSKAVSKEKLEELVARREKLRKLITNENQQYQVELKELKVKYGTGRFQEMQLRLDHLQNEKETQRKEIADKKLYDHWKQNEPRLREIEFENNKKNAVISWKDQVEEKKQEEKKRKDVEVMFNEMAEDERQKAVIEQEEKEIELQHRNEQLAAVLREQVAALRRKEGEAEMLKNEELKLRLHNQALVETEEKRKAFEAQCKRYDHGRVLIRQYKQQLKQKSQQVQEALEFDLQLLRDIADKEREEEEIKSATKERSKADAEYMHQVVGEQLRLEKIREAEVDRMFQDEAMRQWRKREGEWEREKIARERLMKSVLEERQQQLDEKMGRLHAKQKEAIMERELLLAQIEDHQKSTRHEESERMEKRKQKEEEIRGQISARETEREKLLRKEQEELLRQKGLVDKYEKMLQEEAQRLQMNDDSPPQSFRRKKVAFM